MKKTYPQRTTNTQKLLKEITYIVKNNTKENAILTIDEIIQRLEFQTISQILKK